MLCAPPTARALAAWLFFAAVGLLVLDAAGNIAIDHALGISPATAGK